MTQIVLDMQKLKAMTDDAPRLAEQIIEKLAMDTVAYMLNNMSEQSPSSPGAPPAIDTGFLVNSISAFPEGRMAWVVNVAADYAASLEFGTPSMAARPFFLPAIEAVVADAPEQLIEVIKP